MTREEAIKTLHLIKFHAGRIGKEALDMAIYALRQQEHFHEVTKKVESLTLDELRKMDERLVVLQEPPKGE